jgi:DNA-binding MarR family transcriptional regulator
MSEGRCLASIGSFAPLSIVDLAQRANLHKGQASRAAQSLVDRGLVSKQVSPDDGRGVVLTLTRRGELAWQRVMRVVANRNDELVGCLTATERRQLSTLLDRLITHARAGVARSDDED